MYWPESTVGVAGMGSPGAIVTGAGTVPPLTAQVSVAAVAPAGHTLPELAKPLNWVDGEKKVPGVSGSVMVRLSSGPVDVFFAVIVATEEVPAGMRTGEKAFEALTEEVSAVMV